MRSSGFAEPNGVVLGVLQLQSGDGAVPGGAERGPAHRARSGRENGGNAAGMRGAMGLRGSGE